MIRVARIALGVAVLFILGACTPPEAEASPATEAVSHVEQTTGHRVTVAEVRFCRLTGGGAPFVACLHATEGHRQGQPGHRWTDYQRQARQLRQWINALITPSCEGPSSCEAMVRLLAPRYGVNAQDAVNVMYCESGGNPNASNGGRFLGLYQHGVAWWADRAVTYGIPGASVFDGYANAHVTFSMVRDGGWGPWECQP